MIELEDFEIRVSGRLLVKKANAIFNPGELTALIGRNGSGKSTLLRAIAGFNDNYEGFVKIDGERGDNMNPREFARHLSFVNTERIRIPNLKCRDVIGMGRSPYTDWIGRLSPDDNRIIEESLASMGMMEFAERTMDQMSDGECQRIMIARALAQSSSNILLDEPTSFLDLPNRYELVMLLNEIAHTGNKCIIFSTHELDIAIHLTDKIAFLADEELTIYPSNNEKTRKIVTEKFGLDPIMLSMCHKQ